MEQKQQKLARNAAIYSFFTLLQRGLGFFLLPVYTTVLATEQLGIISTSTAIISFLVLFFGLSLRGSIAYYFYEYKDSNLKYLKKIYGTNVVFILIFSIGCIAFLILTRDSILALLFENIPYKPYILLSLASIFLQPLYFYYQSILKAKQQARKASVLDFVYFGVMIGLALILILGFQFEAEGALLANAIASLLVFIISLIGLQKEIIWCFVPALLKKSLRYSLPLLPHNISGWAMNMIDKVMLNAIDSLSVVALFDVGSQIGKVVNMISLGVNSAYAPWFFDQVKNNEHSKINIARITLKMVILYAVVGIAVSWIAPEFIQIISKPAYHETWKIVPIITTAFVINGFYFTFSYVFFLDKTKYLPVLTVIGAGVNIALNYFLIHEYGYVGAAVASLLTKIFFASLVYYFSQKLYSIPYKLGYIAIIIFLGFIFSLLPLLVQDYLQKFNIWWVFSLKVIILSIFGGYFVVHNIKMIREFIKPKNGR